MKSLTDSQTGDTLYDSNQLKVALVIDEESDLRKSVIAGLRGRGWLVQAVSRAEQAFTILPHIPYSLIVLASELPGISARDFVRILRSSREWQHISLVVMNSSKSGEFAEGDVFLARRPTWEEDLFECIELTKKIRGPVASGRD